MIELKLSKRNQGWSSIRKQVTDCSYCGEVLTFNKESTPKNSSDFPLSIYCTKCGEENRRKEDYKAEDRLRIKLAKLG